MLIGVAALLAIAQAETPKQTDALHRTAVTVHLDRPIGKISPYIYGTNDERPQAWTDSKRHAFGRIGGNRWTAYNWENNASNAGKDWHHQNDGYLSESNEPARAVTDRLDVIQRHGAPALVTVPIQGWVAADKNGDGDVAKSGEDYLTKRFLVNLPWRPKPTNAGPNRSDRFVYQEEFVAFLESQRKKQSDPPIWYLLDNEPDLWRLTHSRLQTKRLDEQEFSKRSIEFARAIKSQAPDALVFGPAVSGWTGMSDVEGQTAWGRPIFIQRYLEAFEAERKRSNGPRLLDVLDVHWYPEHRGGGVRITSDSSAAAVAAQRVEASRSLNDETFIEDSWITRDVVKEPINLLPKLRRLIDSISPGLKLAITEYYFGGGDHPSGAVAQAQVLGISGMEGVFAANVFHLGKTQDQYILAAFDLYRNYDGKGSAFGDTAVDVDRSSNLSINAYAATTSAKGTIILVNRRDVSASVDLRIEPVSRMEQVERYQVAAPVARPEKVAVGNLRSLVLPPMSATLIVAPR
jgi:hypothetical protein